MNARANIFPFLTAARLAACVAIPLFVGGLSAIASDGSGFFGHIAEARDLHDRGVEGDKQAVVDCIAILEKTLKDQPDNQLARVYLGSAYTLRSRDLFPGPQKLQKLKDGGRLMDEAVAAAPDDVRVRFVRAMNYYSLPAIFGKKKLARKELVAISEAASAEGSGLDPAERQGMLYFCGQALRDLKRTDEARTLWKQALAIDPSSSLAPDIRAALKRR